MTTQIKPKRLKWRILVIWKDGTQNFVCKNTTNQPSRFATRREAMELADSFKLGLDKVQSINVVSGLP